ncbi:rRNA maturation RNase YbeY [Ravibacter arvi]|uniref:Endoribonuclease YbeY n=1 Tax=Ravibacter arvi TaxID=2051041 RepID=A0ABP8M9F4_9BACT
MVRFFLEDIVYKVVSPVKTKKWVKDIAESEGYVLGDLNYIFCSDEYLLEMNRTHLSHDYYTDIITFDNSEAEEELEGDIFISIDRVRDNADAQSVAVDEELRRVLAHGVLHLCGYDDHSDGDRVLMREKENYYLSKFN